VYIVFVKMSSGSRSTSRGGKGTKTETSSINKPQKADVKTELPKALDHNPKTQVSLFFFALYLTLCNVLCLNFKHLEITFKNLV
jgi:hypothetical protein